MWLAWLLLRPALGASFGAGVDLATDLPEVNDRSDSDLRSWFPVGLGVRAPVLAPLGGGASLRFTPLLQAATGRTVARLAPGSGSSVSDSVRAALVSAGGLVGPEVRFGSGRVRPALSGGAGAMVVATLLDLDRCGWWAEAEALEGCGGSDPGPALDPLALQLAPSVEVGVGLRFPGASGGPSPWLDLGYGSVGLGASGLGARAVEGLERAPFAYNALRLSFGAWWGADR